jgi:outer membrane protein assembly factor BamB
MTGWVSPTLTGEIFAEPLIFNGAVYAATLDNMVYALNQATGAVIWSNSVGAPQTSGWVCGNISPTRG